MSRPELLYFIDEHAVGWIVRCEDQRYGPYFTLRTAVLAAVAEAEAADHAGFNSMVLLRDRNRVFKPCWVLSDEAHPPLAAVADLR